MTPDAIADYKARYPAAFGPTRRQRAYRIAGAIAFVAFTIYAFIALDFTWERMWNGLDRLGFVFRFMFPPSSGGYFWEYVHALGETIAMALLGTSCASVVALFVGFLAARNVNTSMLGYFAVRRTLDVIRSIDTLIWGLIFVRVVGLGPFAGILAIFVSDVGTLSKLYGEAIEAADRRQQEGIRATGANRPEELRYGILPQVFPVFLSNSLYFLESNTRSATILGVVGAGGIGFHLADRIRLNAWDEVCLIIILILIAVSAIDWISRAIRLSLIGEGRAGQAAGRFSSVDFIRGEMSRARA